MDDQTKPEHMRAALEAGDVAELVRMARVYADMDSPDYPWSQLNEVKKYLGKCADALTRLTKERDANARDGYQCGQKLADMEIRAEAAESRLAELEQEAAKVVDAGRLARLVAEIRQGKSSTPRCEPPGEADVDIARFWVDCVLEAQALDKHRRPS